jgi:hypothetical protein
MTIAHREWPSRSVTADVGKIARKQAPLGVALSPENLVADFGPKTSRAQQAVRALYAAERESTHPAVIKLFEQWRQFFSEATEYKAWAARIENKTPFRALVKNLGLDPEGTEAPRVFFAVDTYYALLVKLVAALAAARLAGNRSAPLSAFASKRGTKLRAAFAALERGRTFREYGIRSFVGGDFFGWYLTAWNEEIEQSASILAQRLAQYDPGPLELDPENARDLLKRPYQCLVPRQIRHDLGEYYTPDWLAERLIVQTLGETDLGDARKRVLDPACGSGTFLVILIKHIRRQAQRRGLSAAKPLELVLRNVVGFDLNPLAVIAARTNYLLALGDLLAARQGEIEIPVFQADSVLTSSPPCSPEPYDYIVGNPPWINWESLPDDYRQRTKALWEHYGLFPHGGMDAILGKGKKDLCMLMTYVALDRYLRNGGKLGFVISQSVFKGAGAAQGFRRFRLPDGTPCGPVAVDDMAAIAAFEGAASRTAILLVTKGRAVRYPVPYRQWFKRKKGHGSAVGLDRPYERVVGEEIDFRALEAEPIDDQDPTSAWLTGRAGARGAVRKLRGASEYVAREGANTGGANAVYWVERVAERRGGLAVVANVLGRAKKRVQTTQAAVETDILFPLIRTADLRRWSAKPEIMIILAQDPARRIGISPAVMERKYPHIQSYLARYERVLRGRAAYRRYFAKSDPYWTMFNIGPYTLAGWKVVWQRMGSTMRAAVCGQADGKPIVPQETLCFVAAATKGEAHYLCAVLNSAPFGFAVSSYSQKGGKSFASPHILENLRVPVFDKASRLHLKLSRLSIAAHKASYDGNDDAVERVELAVDRCAADLWGLSAAELADIRRSLGEA